jgi:Arc/MetJ-type ribon-helix-helix transcriptional regulator
LETVQIRLTKDMISRLDELIKSGDYPNRSEAIRDGVRRLIDTKKNQDNMLISVKDLQNFIKEAGK